MATLPFPLKTRDTKSSKAAATAAAAGRLPSEVSTREKLSGRAKSVSGHVGGNCFRVTAVIVTASPLPPFPH